MARALRGDEQCSLPRAHPLHRRRSLQAHSCRCDSALGLAAGQSHEYNRPHGRPSPLGGRMPYTNYNWITDRLAIGGVVSDPEALPFDAILSLMTEAPAGMWELARSGNVEYAW